MLKWLYGKCECRVELGGDLCYEIEEDAYKCLQCGRGCDILGNQVTPEKKHIPGWLR